MTRGLSAGLPLSALAATLLALFAFDNLLLLAFLGLSPLLTALLALLLCPLVALLAAKAIKTDAIVPWRALVIAGLIALTLFLLGGQGRFFYANADWQVRDAILADMAGHPWPFAYEIEGKAAILRAPLGLYLLPSLFGNGLAEYAMLAANTLRLTLIVAVCWPLFSGNRGRWIALLVFLLFSGLDLVGTALFDRMGVAVGWDHLERWNFNNQFSSHITQVFWVPNHALAGWACAAAFLLWYKGHARIGLFAAIIPLVAIWSPLAIMGALPFALLAGVRVLRQNEWDVRDVISAALASAIALPSLAYMQLDAAKLGGGMRDITLIAYLFLIALEVLPFTIPLLLSRWLGDADRMVLWIILACLLTMPLYQIGTNSDFQMRASIMPLALLAFFLAGWLAKLADNVESSKAALGLALLLLIAGAVTPFHEVRRAITLRPSPKALCSLAGVWNKQQGLQIAPYASYFARTDSLPRWMGSVPVLAGTNDPAECWGRSWTPKGWG